MTPTLVLGPSLGTSADACWGAVAGMVRDEFDVLAWELPGHGTSADPIPTELTIADLADRVLELVDGPFLYAGDSVGGQVGLQLLLEAPERVPGAVLCCTGAKIGDAQLWRQRIEDVRASGTAGLVTSSAERWFAPGFLEREPARASALLHSLRDASDEGYIAVCTALAAYDVRDRLGEITAPVVAVAGAKDPVCPPEVLGEIADGVPGARLVVLDDVAHQAPAERPDRVVDLIRQLAEEAA